MPNIELITIFSVIVFASALAYKSSFLHNKKIGYISLLQVFYLILIPGILYSLIFSYILEVLDRPLNKNVFLKDSLLITFLLLSVLYTYGGVAIHSICKTLNSYFEEKQSLAFKVNSYFHRDFSHNLVFIGAIATGTFFALLELNHGSPYPEQSKFLIIILNGLFVGLASILGLSFYKEKSWLELKFFFLSLWIMIIVLGYAARTYLKVLKSYPFTLMMLIVFSFLASLNIFLFVRRFKHKIKVIWRIPKNAKDTIHFRH